MIREGSEGSINIFFRGLLVSSFPLTKKKTVERYKQQGEEIIRKGKGVKILDQIKAYFMFIEAIYNRKKKNLPIYRTDHINVLNAVMALIRLEVMENDSNNGFYVAPKKKINRRMLC